MAEKLLERSILIETEDLTGFRAEKKLGLSVGGGRVYGQRLTSVRKTSNETKRN